VKVVRNPHGRPDADAMVEVILKGGLVTLLAEAVYAFAENFLLHRVARAGNENVAVRAPYNLKVVGVFITGATGRRQQEEKDKK